MIRGLLYVLDYTLLFCISPWNQELQSFQYDANDYKGLPFDFYGGYIGYIGYVADLCVIFLNSVA